MPATVAIGDIHIPAAELERLYAGIEHHLREAARPPVKPGITLPPVDELIRQAGIVTRAAPRRRRNRRKLFTRSAAPVADHLDAAADVIERRGWAQGTLCRGDARCILGAQMLLIQIGHSSAETARAAARILATATGTPRYQDWNDSPARTKEQVVGLLRRAAAGARRAGS